MKWENIRYIAAGILSIVVMLVSLYLTFLHMDLTLPQLFIEFWYIWLTSFILLGIAYFLLE